MTIESEVFTLSAVREYEKHLAVFSPEEQSKRLKIFINEAGIIRRQLPSTNNENQLIDELCRLMEKPLSETVITRTKELLAADRRTRMHTNSKLIFNKRSTKKDTFSPLLDTEKERDT